jgi:signal transduction histidine kinase
MKTKKILIIDDEFNTRYAIDFALSKAGYKTTNAGNGSEALNLLKESLMTRNLFDLVITDIQMPKMTGMELINEMEKANIRVPILVITGFGDKQTLIELLRHECDDYLDKPFSPDDLLAGVTRVLAKQNKTRQEFETLQHRLLQSEKISLLGQIASGIAREINDPASVIQGYAQLLLTDDAINGIAKKNVSSIYEAVRSIAKLNEDLIAKLTGNLRDIAHPNETGNSEFRPEEPLEKAIEFLKETGVMKYCKLVRQYQNDLPLVSGDLMQLYQIFLNIIVNAFHAMENVQEKILTLSIEHALDEYCVRISIQDSGRGIPSEHMEKIFESHFTTRAAKGGTGLGLAVVKQIIEKHGGTIKVESEVGKGTKFTISLPQNDCPVQSYVSVSPEINITNKL